MQEQIRKRFSKLLREIAERIDTNTCDLTEAESLYIMEILTRHSMSKESACIYLNISRSRFDDLVREGKLPRGVKQRGFKELIWYQSDLDKFLLNRH